MSSAFSVKAVASAGQSEIPPSGSHPAVLVALIDLGTRTEQYQQQAEKDVRKVLLAWELVSEKKSGSTMNHVVGRDYTLSMNEKAALREMVRRWRGSDLKEGEDFDLMKLMGRPCLLTIVHKASGTGRTYAKVDGIAPMPKGMTAPKAQRTPIAWSVAEADLDEGIPSEDGDTDWLPFLYGRPVHEVIKESKEYRQRKGGAPADDGETAEVGPVRDEDTPF